MGVGKDYINRTILVYNGSGGYEDGLLDSVMFEAEYTINYQGEACHVEQLCEIGRDYQWNS